MEKIMKLAIDRTDDTFAKDLILFTPKETNAIPQVVGKITNIDKSNDILIGVDWFNLDWYESDSDDSSDKTTKGILTIHSSNHFSDFQAKFVKNENGINLFKGLEPKLYIDGLLNGQRNFTFVPTEKYDEYSMYQAAAKNIARLYKTLPIYRNLIKYVDAEPVLTNIVDVMFELDEKDLNDALLGFQYSNGYARTIQSLADRILENANIPNGQDLMTQEQQVESFISFSKLVTDEKTDVVSDEYIEQLAQSDAYQQVLDKLAERGFGTSETQQFNVMQSVGYLSAPIDKVHNNNVIYNLSDMGAGKTLMTVEAIYLADLLSAQDFLSAEVNQPIIDNAYGLRTVNKNLIAPKLSVKSSWVDTFKMFYDVTEIDEKTYELSFVFNGVTFKSTLNVASFTVNASTLTVDNTLPVIESAYEFLIIDEIHQIVKRKVSRTRFFEPKTIPAETYKSYILSGTLSNLTTQEWLNYITLMGVKYRNLNLDTDTNKELTNDIATSLRQLRNEINHSAGNISVEQRRYFDPNTLDFTQTQINEDKKVSNKQELYNLYYSSKLLKFETGVTDIQDALIRGDYRIGFDFNILNTPNFELFYQLVGHCAITAQSTQVATELFGEQKTQHNAAVINTPSALTSEDLSLLRTLHEITSNYSVYKSQAIATAINNAILNLNDGLATKNVYELLTSYASSNNRFLEYLSTLDLNILEKLPQSSLINMPELEETPKFKVLKDILESEKDETHLIVVNDAPSMIKLSKALGIESMTKAEVRSQLTYQESLDAMFEKQSIVVVPQMMIKSSLDLVQANRLIQYQLNTEISDIIQTQNRINRIGQTRETKAYYIATDMLQKNIIELFLETYKNIRVAHKGIVELFVDMSSQVTVVNDYIAKAMMAIDTDAVIDVPVLDVEEKPEVTLDFDENGIMDLFPEMEKEPVSTTDDDIVDDELVDLPIINQISLFSPIEIALENQFVPVSE